MDALLLIVVSVLVVLVVLAVGYAVDVWNDLSRRRMAIIAAWANVRGLRARRRSVDRAVARSVGEATRFERDVARVATRRGRGRGPGAPWISDIANGWPATTGVGTVSSGMAVNVASRDEEARMLRAVHDLAFEYNAILASVPRGLIGRLMRFGEWRFTPQRARRTPGRHGRRCR